MSTQTEKISLYNINDLKNTSDDALAPYLTNLAEPYRFKQQHRATDVRLTAGYSAVLIAGALFYADWKLGWDATKPYTAPACIAYFIINSFFTYWIWAVEAGTVFVGACKGGQKITLKSSSQKHKPVYKLHIKYEAASGGKSEDKEVSGLFSDWFNIHGFLDKKAFRSWLARNIEVVALADPQSKSMGDQQGISNEDLAASLLVTGIESSSGTNKTSRKKA